MTTMIEKMARAMILAVSPDRDFTMNPYYEVERNYWEHIIRAGLTAMLEPTPKMTEAGDDVEIYGVSVLSIGESHTVFCTMIQAALDEKEG